MIKGVIFDLDGTLLDTLPDLGDAMNRMLCQLGFPVRTRKEHQGAICYGAREFVRRSLPEGKRDEATVEKALAAYRTYYTAACTVGTKPYAGIERLLRTLNDEGIAVAVYSNKPMAQTRQVTRHYFGEISFISVRGHVDGTPVKPDPTCAFAIAKEMGLSPEQIAFVGDSDVDMQTACRAGMTPLGVCWGYRDADTLRDGGAVAVAEDTDRLYALLKRY